ELSIDAASVNLDDPERTAISILDRPTDKVITAAYLERDEKHETRVEIWAKPATIKGGLNKETCRERYTFRAGFNGGIETWGDEIKN
ncbi:hypothetical protein ABTF26_20350, partial [Acinetobacter baumannii]